MAYCSVTSTPERFASCLSNFQIEDLLVLKKSMELMAHAERHRREGDLTDDIAPSCTNTTDEPQRLALMAADRGVDHGISGQQPWQSDPAWVEEKPSKLQTLFQISITALAFLSFGGYLLCLIVQAIKSKGTTYFHPVATATTTNTNGNVKRIKIYRRSRRRRSINSAHIPNILMADYATYMESVRRQRLGY
ncbi:uncharacterized protein LOC135429741, partial [Drosophila montana]|uniref:uncharacterized protein LOC135429741 n=1 Tax=Drosophila montana TaxID=40370 RepID=UPI00313E6ED2